MFEFITAESVNTTVQTIIIVFFGLIMVGAVVVWLWLRSFNIIVHVRRPIGKGQGYLLETGYKGKYVFASNEAHEKVTRFVILGAKRKKIEYNGDAPDEQFKTPLLVKGKIRTLITFQPDSENQLHPVYFKETSYKNVLEAEISRGDYQYAASAIQTMNDKYSKKDFVEKYGLIIIMVVLLLIAAMQWYTSKNYTESAAAMANAMQSVAASNSQLANILSNSTIAGAPANSLGPVLVG